MINRLIKNEKDYETALSRIEQIMDAKKNTAEMDELELLTALVEMYEERRFPISQPNPVDAIKFRMEQIGLVQKDMIPYIGTKSKVFIERICTRFNGIRSADRSCGFKLC